MSVKSNVHSHHPARRGRSDVRHAVLLIGGLLCGMSLRVYRLGYESLWYDETVSAWLAKQQPVEIIRHTAGDIHPPGYYLMLHGWQRLTQSQMPPDLEFLLGFSSVMWGLLTVAMLYPIGRKLLGRRVALLAVWFTAVNPFHIWYGQEVRMYTMGSTLGLLCLWSALVWLTACRSSQPRNGLVELQGADSRYDTVRLGHRWLPLVTYAAAAALGLYTLYYIGLVLVAINTIVLVHLLHQHQTVPTTTKHILQWLAAQAASLILFAPWFPLFWRQATHPPVPPWRVPWSSLSEFAETLAESMAALLIGQTPPFAMAWPWALLSIGAVILFVRFPLKSVTGPDSRDEDSAPRTTLLLYIFLPIALIYLLTVAVTPLYHVRYLFTYAPPFMIVLSAAVQGIFSFRRWLGYVAVTIVALGSIAALQQFWSNPVYAADDHRQAVSDLADAWRPGDLILVNAGWTYTILDTYWPRMAHGPEDSLPPPIDAFVRLNELNGGNPGYPIVARSGSIDGEESLGWGDPSSDFFAISAPETIAALDEIARNHRRLWHYRIYDTVSDPEGIIRSYLDTHGTLVREIAYPGRDFLSVQAYEMSGHTAQATPPAFDKTVDFGDMLRLETASFPRTHDAGNFLYVDLLWSVLDDVPAQRDDLTMSLRIYDSQGNLLRQRDDPPDRPTSQWQMGDQISQSMALAIPIYAKPGDYTIELVVYRQNGGEVLSPADGEETIDGQRWRLGTVTLYDGNQPIAALDRSAWFDYIDLLDASFEPKTARPGDGVTVRTIWMAQANDYHDNYEARYDLIDEKGDVVQHWQSPIGGPAYPSGKWVAERPILDVQSLPLSPELASGDYLLALSLSRASDGLAIEARTRPYLPSIKRLPLGQLTIE